MLIHHIYQYSGLLRGTIVRIIVGYPFQVLGFLCVGLFFFFSGYGLMYSSSKDDYIQMFIKKRFVPLYLFYLFICLIYIIEKTILHIPMSSNELILSLFIGKTVAMNTWYLQVTFVIYILFYLTFKYVRDKEKRILMFTIEIIVLCVALVCCKMSSLWYEALLAVPFGMWWCKNKRYIDEKYGIKFQLVCICSLIVFSFLLLSSFKFGIVFKMLSIIAFITFVLSVAYLLTNTRVINNRISQWLGKYSLNIYVCQGVFLWLRKNEILCIVNPYIFILISFFGTLILAMCIEPVRKFIYKIKMR